MLTLIGMGAPVSPEMYDDPGGITITSAPMPAVRVRVVDYKNSPLSGQTLTMSIGPNPPKDQGYLQCYRHNTDQRADRPVHQIADDHSIHHD